MELYAFRGIGGERDTKQTQDGGMLLQSLRFSHRSLDLAQIKQFSASSSYSVDSNTLVRLLPSSEVSHQLNGWCFCATINVALPLPGQCLSITRSLA